MILCWEEANGGGEPEDGGAAVNDWTAGAAERQLLSPFKESPSKGHLTASLLRLKLIF